MTEVLRHKVAIVTGAGRGIGRGIARLMADEGAKVVVVDPGVNLDGTGFDPSVADKTAAEIGEAGGEAVPCYESVVTMEGGERIVKTAVDSFGKLDIVVTCAGILRDRMAFNMTEQEWDDVIAVHLKGTFTVVKPACVLFRQQRSGRVITFTSDSGLVGRAGQANYGAAKSAIAGFTKVVARDMGQYGITANAVAPTAATRILGSRPGGISEELRSLHPEAIAPFVVYLASEYAANVNGQTFLVVGGDVSLMSQPRPQRSIYSEGRWTTEQLAPLAREYLTARVDNPAPPQ